MIPTTRNDRSRPRAIVSPVRQFVTVVSIVGGSAGVPSACSSLMVKVIQSSCPGPDSELSVSEHVNRRMLLRRCFWPATAPRKNGVPGSQATVESAHGTKVRGLHWRPRPNGHRRPHHARLQERIPPIGGAGRQVLAVQFHKVPLGFGRAFGYIQLSLRGGSEAKAGLLQSYRDENSVWWDWWRRGRSAEFEEARELILARISPKAAETKVCPDCAETVKAAALVCRFCGHRFAESTPKRPS